jgi:uncharacterized protein (DUF2147 family)
MRNLIIAICLVSLLYIPVLATAQKAAPGDAILGSWFNAEKDAIIDITRDGKNYTGQVNWLKNPLNDKGKPKTDIENPDPKLKSRPRLGLVILTNLVYKNSNKYEKGKIYDPKSGKTYSAQAELANHNLLKLRGYIGVSLIGRTTEWVRTEKPDKDDLKAVPKP